MRAWCVLFAGILFPLPVLADGAVGLRITDEGLDWIADQALSQVPDHMDLDDIEVTLMECWPRDSSLDLWQGRVEIEHLNLGFPFSDDEVGIAFDAGARVTGTVILDAIACLPLSVSCDMQVDVDRALANASIGVAPGQGGRLTTQLGAIDLVIEPGDIDIEFSNCTGEIDDRLDELYDQAEPILLNIVREQLQSWIDDNVRPRVDALLGQALSFPVESAGVEATITASGIDRANRALQLSASVGIRALAISDCITPDGETELAADTGLQFTQWEPSPFAIGITERVLDEALLAAWQAGNMCFPAKDLSALDGLIEGIPPGVDMQLTFALGAPPNVDIQPDGVHLTLAGISAILDASTDEGTTRAEFHGGATARAVLDLDPATNGLHLRTTDLTIEEMDMTEGELPDGVDLRAVIENLVFPTIYDYVGNVRIIDSVVPASGFWMIVNAIDYYDGAAALAFELFIEPEDDTGRPHTIVRVGPDEVVRPGTAVAVRVGGEDDLIPERLLRYQMLRPGEDEWTELSFSPTFTLRQYGEAEWVYRIRAVDLAGNVDDDPAKLTLVVEGAPDLDHPDTLPRPDDEEADDPEATASQADAAGGCSCRQAPQPTPASSWPGITLALAVAVVSLTRRWPRA